MRKLQVPQHDPLAAFDACVNAIGELPLRANYNANRASIEQANADFDAATQDANWAGLPRVARGNAGALVAGDLSKKQMMDLYSVYMVGTTGPSRDIYDELLTAAGGLCPFCGDLGHVGTLDHYLPKANFPAFSVNPRNLVPCCRDCNSGKNASFGLGMHEQTLHPYLDHGQFFEQRWITATVHRSDPVLIQFECTPPPHWETRDKQRVERHFDAYKLGYRFSVQAGGEISKVVQLRAKALRALTRESYQEFLIENANCPDFVLNGWSRTMYQALGSTDWFVQADFDAPNWHLAFEI